MTQVIVWGLTVAVAALVGLFGFRIYTVRKGVAAADRDWVKRSSEPIGDVGATESLCILPLVNWHAAGEDLKTEAGVSYLVKTDENTILYDVGFNYKNESPSPLEHNMQQLGVDLDDIESIFLSHNHPDHAGGMRWSRQDTFSLGTDQVPLDDKAIFVPVEMTYPGAELIKTSEPQQILGGVASIGTISRQLFLGWVEEQAMAINVAGKGIVVIVGCAHQTLPKILQRTDELFDDPIYGVIGDLHFPVPEGRMKILGLDIQRRFASGQGIMNPLTRKEADSHINRLAEYDPGLVGLGGHDTSDEIIEECKRRFDGAYEPVKVGRSIQVSEEN